MIHISIGGLGIFLGVKPTKAPRGDVSGWIYKVDLFHPAINLEREDWSPSNWAVQDWRVTPQDSSEAGGLQEARMTLSVKGLIRSINTMYNGLLYSLLLKLLEVGHCVRQ